MNFKILLFLSVPLLASSSTFGFEKPLTASAGPNQIVTESSMVQLDASGTTHRDGALLTFIWVQVGGADVVIKGMSHIKASFRAPELTTNDPFSLAFELKVKDEEGHSSSDIVRVMVKNVNHPPLVSIESPEYVDEETPVILDASASSDVENDPLDFFWRQVQGPSVILSHPGIPMVVFTSPSLPAEEPSSSLLFELTVRDDCGGFSTSTIRVHVAHRFPSQSERSELSNQSNSLTPINSMEILQKSKKEWRIKDLTQIEMDQANEFFKKGELEKAHRHCERALILYSGNIEAFEMIQRIQQAKWDFVEGELKQARNDFTQRDYLGCMRHVTNVKVSDATNREATSLGVVSLEALQQRVASQPALDDKGKNVSVGKNKKNSELSRRFYNEGLICYSQGQVRQALAVWRKSWSLDPENIMAMNAFNRASMELK